MKMHAKGKARRRRKLPRLKKIANKQRNFLKKSRNNRVNLLHTKPHKPLHHNNMKSLLPP
jgi:hypothetical protein